MSEREKFRQGVWDMVLRLQTAARDDHVTHAQIEAMWHGGRQYAELGVERVVITLSRPLGQIPVPAEYQDDGSVEFAEKRALFWANEMDQREREQQGTELQRIEKQLRRTQ